MVFSFVDIIDLENKGKENERVNIALGYGSINK